MVLFLAIVLAIIAIGILIIVHEGGHYLLARLSGMRVDRFSIGFGPALFKIKRGETTFQVGVFPLGGYVQIAGLNPGDDSIAPDDPRAYPNRPVYQRLLTIFAGPATNYLFATLVMAITWMAWGVPTAGSAAVVDELIVDKPAARAGMQVEDELVSVDGKAVGSVDNVATLIDASQGRTIAVVVKRAGAEKTLMVTPIKDESGKYRIGIQIGPNAVRVRQSPGTALVSSLVWPYQFTKMQLSRLAMIFRGSVSAKSLSGPVGIVRAMKDQILRGSADAFEFVAMISVALGLFNLLPVPALDGGRIVFLLAEGISRRRVNQRLEQTVHLVGLLALLGLILYVTGHDIARWIRR